MPVPNFKKLAQHEKIPRKTLRYLALANFIQGKSRSEIAEYFQCSRRSVNLWVKNYLTCGLKGLEEKNHPGRPPLLTTEQKEQLSAYVKEASLSPSGGRLTGYDIRDFIKDKFDVSFSVDNVYKILHNLNFSWITSRSKHPKQSQEVQDNFKKTL